MSLQQFGVFPCILVFCLVLLVLDILKSNKQFFYSPPVHASLVSHFPSFKPHPFCNLIVAWNPRDNNYIILIISLSVFSPSRHQAWLLKLAVLKRSKTKKTQHKTNRHQRQPKRTRQERPIPPLLLLFLLLPPPPKRTPLHHLSPTTQQSSQKQQQQRTA